MKKAQSSGKHFLDSGDLLTRSFKGPAHSRPMPLILTNENETLQADSEGLEAGKGKQRTLQRSQSTDYKSFRLPHLFVDFGFFFSRVVLSWLPWSHHHGRASN